jgi:hypothetical protein
VNSSSLLFSSLLAIENLQNHFFFEFLVFDFDFWRNSAREKTKKQKCAAPRVCQKLPSLRRARDLSALLSERRLVFAELEKGEATGDGV